MTKCNSPFRHPKSCKFGRECKFFKKKCCVYKHIDKRNDEVKNTNESTKDLETEVESLKAEIEELKSHILSKEEALYKMSTEKENCENNLFSKITNMQKEIEELKILNDDEK